MNPTPSPNQNPPPVVFDQEKLDVYQLELKFIERVTPLLDEEIAYGPH